MSEHDERTAASPEPAPEPNPGVAAEGQATSTSPGEVPPSGGGRLMRHLWREWIIPVSLVLLVMLSIRSAVADWNDVPTGSMKPTIVEGDRIFVNKAAYDLRFPFTLFRLAEWGSPERGEIVVLFSPEDGKRLVKRVVGVPGDEIQLRRGRLYVNGSAADYQPLDQETINAVDPDERDLFFFFDEAVDGESHPVMLADVASNSRDYGPRVVPDGHYFVMGDNRDRSKDSRYFGFVHRSRIVGRATAVVLSLQWQKSDRAIPVPVPRWDRFFQKLR